jgi:hypothetical protein
MHSCENQTGPNLMSAEGKHQGVASVECAKADGQNKDLDCEQESLG